MAAMHSNELKRDVVRIARAGGLTRPQVESDLHVGFSTLNKWVKMVSDEAGLPDLDHNLLREHERLRPENRNLKEERDLLKKATQFFAAQKPSGLPFLTTIPASFRGRMHAV